MRSGQRVAVPAHYFDRKDDNSWSVSHFGEKWSSTKCFGTVINVRASKTSAKVKWDIDKQITNVKLSDLEIVHENNGK